MALLTSSLRGSAYQLVSTFEATVAVNSEHCSYGAPIQCSLLANNRRYPKRVVLKISVGYGSTNELGDDFCVRMLIKIGSQQGRDGSVMDTYGSS